MVKGLLVLIGLLSANTMLVFSQADSIQVQFELDARSLQKPLHFGLRGSVFPLRWDKTYLVNDPDGDGIYHTTFQVARKTATIMEYKMVYGDKKVVFELKNGNRVLVLDSVMPPITITWDVPLAIDVKTIPLLTSAQVSEDYQIVRQALTELHPGLYRYRSKWEIDSVLGVYDAVFSVPMSYREAYLQLSRLTSFIQCGHTFPSFYNQNDFIEQVVFDQPDKLPLTFRIYNNRIFIEHDLSANPQLKRGSELLAIDSRSSQEILAAIELLVKADGPENPKRMADLQLSGYGKQEAFDIYYPLLYPVNNQKFRLSIRESDTAATKYVEVPAVRRSERSLRLASLTPAENEPIWKFELWENQTAYLKLGTFDSFQLKFSWKNFLDDAFKQMKKQKVTNLIIDIRGNEGGQDEILLYLGQQIAKNDIELVNRKELVRYRVVPDKLRPYVFTWDNSYYDLSKRTKPYDSLYYELKGIRLTKVAASEDAFGGKIYVLVNATNSSATFYLAEIVKKNKLATLIGETTGGSQQGLNAGVMFFLRLPHSQIEIDIPLVGTFSEQGLAGGISPDIEVIETVNDMRSNLDPVLLQAKKIIATNLQGK